MDNQTNGLSLIKTETYNITSKILQSILVEIKKKDLKSSAQLDEIVQILWNHLITILPKFDDQLLCCTSFYTALVHCSDDVRDFYITEISQIIEKELFKDSNNDNTIRAISLIYGMFQSSFLKDVAHGKKITSILNTSFSLLIAMSYEYSQNTFIVFKTVNFLKKLIGTQSQYLIFNTNNQIQLLNVINHNWENPITGVRDLNKSNFKMLLSVVDTNIYKQLLEEIHRFNWNKAKYLMFSEIIEHSSSNLIKLSETDDFIKGLLHSLHKPGLVSAGADMYFSILKRISFDNEWCQLFLEPIMKLLSGSSEKAIANFSNYWCLTTFKKYPYVFKVLIKELENVYNAHKLENIMKPSLYIMKQGNKLGLLDKNMKYAQDLVSFGLRHCDETNRMLAFDIVCISGKELPSMEVYEDIVQFLKYNVNSDCTILRINMLNSLNHFLMNLQSTFQMRIKSKGDDDFESIVHFSKLLQEFITTSFEINGNYQRKITNIKILGIVFSTFKGIMKTTRKHQAPKKVASLIDYLQVKDAWILSGQTFLKKLMSFLNDPAEDIRENIVNLLMSHYSYELTDPESIACLIESAKKNVASKFFYEISCGQIMFKLMTYILITQKVDTSEVLLKNAEEIYYFAFNELKSEHEKQTDVVSSIQSGKQLHSFIGIISTVLQTCQKTGYKMNIPHEDTMQLLSILSEVSNQFSQDQGDLTSSDFSKIDEMVHNFIVNAGISNVEDEKDVKISGLHQLVLNCLWLNVKASCDLASLIVQFNKEDSSHEPMERCLHIIAHVLETSRHKGAIEAAGVALGKSVQHLTSLPDTSTLGRLPLGLLRSKLDKLLSDASDTASVTRRGAGLSIMFHRIVSCDMQKGKPLFHYFMKRLLEKCLKTGDVPKNIDEKSNINENEKDLPKAVCIHFLTKVVTDSGLASDSMYYSAELAELAFGNLTSSHWQIRNAALQLYGALVPKLIGQKKPSGEDEETTATVACDELRTHSPKLWFYIQNELKVIDAADTVNAHSNLVPILSLLSSGAKRYNFSYDMEFQVDSDAAMLQSLMLLLGSPIYTVRRLTAKCIYKIYPFLDIYEIISGQTFYTENMCHGNHMLLNLYRQDFSGDCQYKKHFGTLKNKFEELDGSGRSYVSRTVYEQVFSSVMTISNLEKLFHEIEGNNFVPGIHHWLNNTLQKYLMEIPWCSIPPALHILLNQPEYERPCQVLYLRLKQCDSIPEEVLRNIAKILLAFHGKFQSFYVWKILYKISQKIALHNMCIQTVLEFIESHCIPYKQRYVLPFIAKILPGLADSNTGVPSRLCKIISKLADYDNLDSDMRCIAAIAINELSLSWSILPEQERVTVLKCSLTLLQDEDSTVRDLAVIFYKHLAHLHTAVQPYVCLYDMLNHKFLEKVFQNPEISITVLCNEMLVDISRMSSNKSVEECNPFANESKNIYIETDDLKQMVVNLINSHVEA